MGDQNSIETEAASTVQAPVTTGLTDVKVFQAATDEPSSSRPLQDEDLEPTADEVRKAHASLVKQSKALNERTLSLARHREDDKIKAEKSKEEKWPTTTIRIRFSDRTQIQKVFPSTGRIGAVYEFVRSSLSAEAKEKPFSLYEPPSKVYPETTPPLPATYLAQNKHLPPQMRKPPPPDPSKQTLMQLQLVPQSVLLFRFDAPHEELNRPNVKAPLLPELLGQAAPLPPPPVFNEQTGDKGQGQSVGTSATTGEKKIPKWLQKGLLKRK